MSTTKPVYAFQILPTVLYDTPRINATIVRVTDEGELHSPGYGYKYDDQHLNDFAVSAWARDNGTLDGFSAEYREPFSVDLKRAEGMVKHLRKVQRGMDKINSAEGYVSDYASYLLRVARVLGIKTFYVRNDRDARNRSGERWRKTDGYGVQYYIQTVAARNGALYTYDN